MPQVATQTSEGTMHNIMHEVEIVATVETEASNGENKTLLLGLPTLLATPHPSVSVPIEPPARLPHLAMVGRSKGQMWVGFELCRDQTAEHPLEN